MAVRADSSVEVKATLGLDDIEGVMRIYRGRILRYAMFAVRDRDAAETITQECFLKAYRARESFRGECSLSTWLMQIAVNLVRDYARSKQFQFWKRAQSSAIDVAEVTEFLAHPSASAETGLLARERLKSVWAAVEKLSKMQREVFVLRFVEEMELLEIAAVMGMKESTVKSHLYRALNTVRTRVLAGKEDAQ
ncbi:RNA polymerase sigma-54 factor RpoN [Acidisarcina polymorpha]|uniref:RNA polymerase sigma-54 factor RpoN n=2 Tax=Acidisarcina polymorpha TaxID=2211140 RepID=A0A2Z5G9I1_9BACT|nr:RNA polymerase sigma-54 factor RpoN [Acidisarcina polymorpha]